jgi:hypothetical protein
MSGLILQHPVRQRTVERKLATTFRLPLVVVFQQPLLYGHPLVVDSGHSDSADLTVPNVRY